MAAEDFVYLWQQVTGNPGAIDAAGYRLISDINARDAGKVVEVVFDKPYPGWRELFSDLLPAHLLKDAPGGWAGALQNNYPATAGPYALKTLDTDRGEVVLERNDRYWGEPPTLDRIVLRRADQTGIVEALEAGHDQLALARTDSVGANLLADLEPGDHREDRGPADRQHARAAPGPPAARPTSRSARRSWRCSTGTS